MNNILEVVNHARMFFHRTCIMLTKIFQKIKVRIYDVWESWFFGQKGVCTLEIIKRNKIGRYRNHTGLSESKS